MKDWAEYLEGFTVEMDNLDAFYDKCREYVGTLTEEEFPLFHADLLPYHLQANANDRALMEAVSDELGLELVGDPVEFLDFVSEELKQHIVNAFLWALPYRTLAAAFNDRILGTAS